MQRQFVIVPMPSWATREAAGSGDRREEGKAWAGVFIVASLGRQGRVSTFRVGWIWVISVGSGAEGWCLCLVCDAGMVRAEKYYFPGA